MIGRPSLPMAACKVGRTATFRATRAPGWVSESARSRDQPASKRGNPGPHDARTEHGDDKEAVEAGQGPGNTDRADKHEGSDTLRVLQG